MKIKTTLLLLFISLTGIAQTKKTDYLQLMDKSLYVEKANLRMEIFSKGKLAKFYEMTSFRNGEKMRLEFSQPATERGRKMLNDESNLWMYLPRTTRVMRLPLKQAFMGSDASNRDLMRLSFSRDYTIIESKEQTNYLILTLKAKDLSVSYNKVVLTIDKDKLYLLKQEMYGLSDKIVKTMIFDDHILLDGLGFPTSYTIVDNLLNNSKTTLKYSEVKRKNDLSNEFFTLGSLKK